MFQSFYQKVDSYEVFNPVFIILLMKWTNIGHPAIYLDDTNYHRHQK